MNERFIELIKALRAKQNPEKTIDKINETLKKGGDSNT